MVRKKKPPAEGQEVKIDPNVQAEDKELEAKGLRALRESSGKRNAWGHECRTCGGFWKVFEKPFHFKGCNKI